ncbi:MAG TPA: hypothetical protein DEB06_10465, partial [Phycisphaerales bacterium]|nr:hypothetical protein [Phycisphaerales bacterium]
LVVVAIIAILIGILLPALGRARSAAFQTKGLAMQKQLTTGLISYASSNDSWIPGLNTTGLRVRILETQTDKPLDNKSNLPTQTWDWMTAALDGENLPAKRAERLLKLMNEFKDPAMREISQPTSNSPQDIKDLASTMGGFPGVSFIMPSGFLWFGQQVGTGVNTTAWGQPDWEKGACKIPTAYQPKYDRVGNASKKIAIADAHRVVEATGSKIDGRAWISPDAGDDKAGGLYGAFVDSGAAAKWSVSYARKDQGNPSNGANIATTYRHGGKMNAAFWDGSASALAEEESRQAVFWYPSRSELGSEVQDEAKLDIRETNGKFFVP